MLRRLADWYHIRNLLLDEADLAESKHQQDQRIVD